MMNFLVIEIGSIYSCCPLGVVPKKKLGFDCYPARYTISGIFVAPSVYQKKKKNILSKKLIFSTLAIYQY